jgi:hypothetical protein
MSDMHRDAAGIYAAALALMTGIPVVVAIIYGAFQ